MLGTIGERRKSPKLSVIIDELDVRPMLVRNLIVDGRRTTMRLEPEAWDALQVICAREDVTLNQLVSLIARRRNETLSLTSLVRSFLYAYPRRTG